MKYEAHFGKDSSGYLAFRPTYPPELFSYLSSLTTTRHWAWDCGTGNGQAAIDLSTYFEQVIASDINIGQLKVAPKNNGVYYVCANVAQTPLHDNSVDLITVAQALHWFANDAFYKEVKRIAKPGAHLAAWCYSLCTINPDIDEIISYLYSDLLWWPPERNLIDERYETILFPFTKIATPAFFIEKQMDYEQLIGYLSTWSAVKEYQRQHGNNPIEMIAPQLKKRWGALNIKKQCSWPIHLLVGKIK